MYLFKVIMQTNYLRKVTKYVIVSSSAAYPLLMDVCLLFYTRLLVGVVYFRFLIICPKEAVLICFIFVHLYTKKSFSGYQASPKDKLCVFEIGTCILLIISMHFIMFYCQAMYCPIVFSYKSKFNLVLDIFVMFHKNVTI